MWINCKLPHCLYLFSKIANNAYLWDFWIFREIPPGPPTSSTNMRGLPGPQVPPRNTHADGTSQGGSSDRLLSVSGKKKCSHCKEELGKFLCFLVFSAWNWEDFHCHRSNNGLSNNPFAMKYLVANRYLQLNLKHSWKLMMMAMSVITAIFQIDIFPRELYFHPSQIDDVRM